jgi:hypothetical protein
MTALLHRYDYLEEVIDRAARTSGPILECGSGLTSLLLGLYAGPSQCPRRGRWSTYRNGMLV